MTDSAGRSDNCRKHDQQIIELSVKVEVLQRELAGEKDRCDKQNRRLMEDMKGEFATLHSRITEVRADLALLKGGTGAGVKVGMLVLGGVSTGLVAWLLTLAGG
ncbi:MAG: hypothetical protein HQL53_07870 [Magnetococcales bacterium]|nr:hypothetical protein [Magnetococcales bacterium]